MYNPFKLSYLETEDKRSLTIGYGYVAVALVIVTYGVFKIVTR